MKPRITAYHFKRNPLPFRWTVILDSVEACLGYGLGRNIRQAHQDAVKCAHESYRDRRSRPRHKRLLEQHGLAPKGTP